jgi:hypothetical protein
MTQTQDSGTIIIYQNVFHTISSLNLGSLTSFYTFHKNKDIEQSLVVNTRFPLQFDQNQKVEGRTFVLCNVVS